MIKLFSGKADLSILKDPFATKNIKDIRLWYSEWYREGWKWVATIDFENGTTKGSQKLEHKDFETIVRQIHSFLESIN